ncbi:MAG: ferric siderophore ABC transporter substrate-binding protein [Flavobacteriales bacterium]|nr:ferric siderophore ABC transporter substrate-binding protein [Flavobacteriales bacterium]
MNKNTTYKSDTDNESKVKSGIITATFTLILLLMLYFFKLYTTPTYPPYEEIAIDFGYSNLGDGFEEPMETVEEYSEPQPQNNNTSDNTSSEQSQKILTEENTTDNIPTVAKVEKPNQSKKIVQKDNSKSVKKETTKTSESNEKKQESQSDGKGKSIADLLVKGKGKSNSTSQGSSGEAGNAGSLDGEGEFIGNGKGGRSLTHFIPGTEGRSNEPTPAHNCGNEKGTIVIAYTVDKSGNVISAYRKSGNASPCIKNTAIAWVYKYVKAEPGKTQVSSTYKIDF